MAQFLAATDIHIGTADGIKILASRDVYYVDRYIKSQAKQLAKDLLSVTSFLRSMFDLPDTLTIRIAKTKGRTNCGVYSNGYKTAVIDPRGGRKDTLETVAHELVHAEQYHTGRLVHDVSIDKHNNVRFINEWEGKPINSKGRTYNSYRNLPQEIEAFARQEKLGSKIAKAIKWNASFTKKK